VAFLDEHPFFAPQTRWVLANCGIIDPASIEEYIARGGYKAVTEAISKKTPQELCEEVGASELRGRGGGGFPTGEKWQLALHAHGDRKYLICNADEGNPGAFMDPAVLEGDPHRGPEVLDQIVDRQSEMLTIMITAYASLETAVTAIKRGAYDFLAKPFTPEELKNVVGKAAGRILLAKQARRRRSKGTWTS
jgi:hypothetical protein